MTWFEGKEFAIGQRVRLADEDERLRVGAEAGRVMGYDAAGPRRGEQFIRVLVMVDGPGNTIHALPPARLVAERDDDRTQIARTQLVEIEKALGPEQFPRLLEWLAGDVCAKLLEDPTIHRKNVRLGGLTIAGLLLEPMRRIAAEQRKSPPRILLSLKGP
jgi:hypothetical protein